MPHDLANLHSRWDALFRGLGTPHARHHEFEQLARHYREPHRGYHNLAHIADCLHHFDSVRYLARRDADAIEAAIFFHDVIYDPRGTDNEGASAQYAEAALTRISAEEPFQAEVRRLILLTRHDLPPQDIAGQLILDIDLASLAVDPETFDANGRNIRREFADVDEVSYRDARRRILQRFLDRPRIYYTDVFFNRCEAAARANLQRAVAALQKSR